MRYCAFSNLTRAHGRYRIGEPAEPDIIEPFQSINTPSLPLHNIYSPYRFDRNIHLSERSGGVNRPDNHVDRRYMHTSSPADPRGDVRYLRGRSPTRGGSTARVNRVSPYASAAPPGHASDPGEGSSAAEGGDREWEDYCTPITFYADPYLRMKPSLGYRCVWLEHGAECGYEAKRGPVRRHIEGKHLAIK